jgi:hypothetical protein
MKKLLLYATIATQMAAISASDNASVGIIASKTQELSLKNLPKVTQFIYQYVVCQGFRGPKVSFLK